ncbi:DUF4438 domain-containing protein [Candidatus Bathyarchaeota archaeon]|nr:DUF4438 domain-containing protein [Candidatus Bathyarchaeota archaeon]
MSIRTNKDRLVRAAAMGEVNHPWTNVVYDVAYDGTPRIGSGIRLGMYGLKYNIKVGDLCGAWAESEHVEPGFSITNPNPAENNALALMACIGNEVTMKTGDAKGAKGVITGKHGSLLVWLPDEDHQKVTIGDKAQVQTWGVGLKIEGFEDVGVHKCSPTLLERMGLTIENGRLVVPVAAEFPAHIMGSGLGMDPHTVDYDVQSTCDEEAERLGVGKLRLGDVVAIHDHLNLWGRGYYEGAVSIGVVIHGWSHIMGHGPGVTTILGAMPGRIETQLNPEANIVNILDLK